MKQIEKDFKKCYNTVLGCRTIPQMTTAVNMCTAFIKLWTGRAKNSSLLKKETLAYAELLENIQRKRIKVIQDYGLTLEGQRCMTVGNENTPVEAGTVQGFIDWDKQYQDFLPLVKYDGKKETYLCMGIVLPYNKQLQDELNAMDYKDRWNAVCRPHATMS